MNKVYKFASATGRIAALKSIGKKLESIERDLENGILRVQVSVLLEAIPNQDASNETKKLLDNARRAFGTHVLGSQRDRFVYSLFSNGQNVFPWVTVEVDYEKYASFFSSAISFGNTEAFAFLGRQYQRGLGIEEDKCKALEFFMNRVTLKDSECFFEIGGCFRFGCRACWREKGAGTMSRSGNGN